MDKQSSKSFEACDVPVALQCTDGRSVLPRLGNAARGEAGEPGEERRSSDAALLDWLRRASIGRSGWLTTVVFDYTECSFVDRPMGRRLDNCGIQGSWGSWAPRGGSPGGTAHSCRVKATGEIFPPADCARQHRFRTMLARGRGFMYPHVIDWILISASIHPNGAKTIQVR